MNEHTKGKLKIMPYTRRDGDNIRWIKDEGNKAICQTFKPRAEANAYHLVLCWNTHDTLTKQRNDLLAVCEKVINWETGVEQKTGRAPIIPWSEIVEIAKAALAAAE